MKEELDDSDFNDRYKEWARQNRPKTCIHLHVHAHAQVTTQAR